VRARLSDADCPISAKARRTSQTKHPRDAHRRRPHDDARGMTATDAAPLLRPTTDDVTRWHHVRWVTLGASACGVVGLVAAARSHRLGAWDGVHGKLLPSTPAESARAGPNGPLRRVTLYDHCVDDETKAKGAESDFWTFGREGARVVRHNYEAGDFFKYENGIPMKREMIEDGLYAWTLETRDFDWEFGFALGNVENEQYYEIGTSDTEAPLTRADNLDCVQKYGKYFNRVVTHEENPLDISYVFGSCLRECPAGYTDYSMVPKPVSGELSSMATDPNASLDLGESQDARLIIPSSVMFLGDSKDKDTGINPILRSGLQKDTTFTESPAAVRWIVGGIDYWRMYLKMAKVEIYIENGHARMRFISQKRHTLSSTKGYPYRTVAQADWRVNNVVVDGCTNVFCDPMQYDLSTLYGDADNADMRNYVLKALLYRSLKVGDSAPTYHKVTTGIQSEPNCRKQTCTSEQRAAAHFLEGAWSTGANRDRTLFQAGTWGPDMDVRRLTITSGVLCSIVQNGGNCMFSIARAFDPGSSGWHGYTGPTNMRKQYVLAALVGSGWKMARVEVFLEAGALKVKALDSSCDHSVAASDHNDITGDPVRADISAIYRKQSSKVITVGPMPSWLETDGNKMGVGGLYFELAGSMVPSLVGI